MIEIKRLRVQYNEQTVGYLQEMEDDSIAFQYDKVWQKTGFSISPFSLPLSNTVFISSSPYFEGLFGVFYDSLPDGWGQLMMIRLLAGQGIDYDRLSVLTKLSLVSSNGLGGLEYYPAQSVNEEEYAELGVIAEGITALLAEKENEQQLKLLGRVSGSAGGARPKAHIRIDDDYWIIKFPAHQERDNAGREEYNANELARKCGINTNDYALFQNRWFAARRFDRLNGRKVHTVSLSGLLETSHRLSNLDYMHLFNVVKKICIRSEDLTEAYRRMCFNVLYGNKDDHGKNFSFVYDEKAGGYRLSPFYDITCTPNAVEHEMTVLDNGKPTVEDLYRIAKKIGICDSVASKTIETVRKIISTQN